ncbi:kinase-like domain-containing protein [Hygrophoropsis aurantiaca]|uniref:Kinase-like domain-containing protein n=1 Tax=Hygrophoropsis aurantiaca TaxID=72124 RepID=A0ACB8AUC1_9AGAM|nr:kinase-like domain-containing protein [Hygrophoropsis aurantiaca]
MVIMDASHPEVIRARSKSAVKQILRHPLRSQLWEEDRLDCESLVQNTPIFPALVAYAYIHRKLCRNERDPYTPIQKMIKYWNMKTTVSLLQMHDEIRDTLIGSPKSQACNGYCKYFLDGRTMHIADIEYTAATLSVCVTKSYASDEDHTQFFGSRGGAAESLIGLLRALMSAKSKCINERYKQGFTQALIKLARKSLQFDSGLRLRDVNLPEDFKFESLGASSGIIKGELAGRMVAVKILINLHPEDRDSRKGFYQEMAVCLQLKHPNCVPFYGTYDVGGSLGIVTPWMEKGSLRNYLDDPDTRNQFDHCIPFIWDIARGLEYLHGLDPHITHCDLKPENILLTSNEHLCLADFGISNSSSSKVHVPTSRKQLESSGSLLYMAPDMLNIPSEQVQSIAPECDVYSFGTICFEIIAGSHPLSNFLPCSGEDLRNHIMNQDVNFALPYNQLTRRRGYTGMGALIQKMRKAKAKDRWTLQKCIASLPLFNDLRPDGDPKFDTSFLVSYYIPVSDPFEVTSN